MKKLKTKLAGWGNYPSCSCNVSRPEQLSELSIAESNCLIARGRGRSYGDAALNENRDVVLTERLNRFIAFDEKTGLLSAESGVTIHDLLDTFVPRGWFPPVTPGTKEVSLGGCIAADVHGKNHHVDGAIGHFVEGLTLAVASGQKLRCSRLQHRDLFIATLGGMGLTGIITDVSLRLAPIETSSIVVKHTPAVDLEGCFDLILDEKNDDKYSVAWIDALATGTRTGRGIVMTGHHATLDELSGAKGNPLALPRQRSFSIPFNMPSWLLNGWDMALFNKIYYAQQCRRKEPFIVDYNSFFYPLDGLAHWNRLYGKKGFVQYQCVLPFKGAREGLKSILQQLASAKYGSFLAVLKKFGPQGEGLLSFPCEGLTLALDIPMRDSALLLPLLDRLDDCVIRYGGRCYLAKDARMKPEAFRLMYPQFEAWHKIKMQVDPRGLFNSDLSRRLRMAT